MIGAHRQLAVSAAVASVVLAVLFVASKACTAKPRGAMYVAMGSLRAIWKAEGAYYTANRGWYDKVECLVRPEDCIPGYQGPSFLESSFLAETEHYHREFHPGPAPAAAVIVASHASPSSLEAFAVVAIPVGLPRRYGGLCIDSSVGRLCMTPQGGRPRVVRGACVVTPGGPSILETLGMRWRFGDEEPCYALRFD
jgi:hypothetical protein